MPHDSIPPDLRRKIRKRAEYRCEYCRYPQIACYAQFHFDHFIPKSRGGLTTFDNLVFACPTCNGAKHARVNGRDPSSGRLVALFNPRLHRWDEHFRWSPDGLRIIGRTAIGRATIHALRFNRRGVSILRVMLIELGLHPPKQ